MKKIGITGGIGSGKTTVAKIFEQLGVSVFYADEESKNILHQNEKVKEQLIAVFGQDLYPNNTLDRAFLAARIFNNPEELKMVNAIVHPAVAEAFTNWANQQKGQYVLQEAAILFETGGYKRMDANILVTAPEDLRIKRVMKRNAISQQEVKERMKNQWKDEQKMPLADFVIHNNELEMLIPQVLKIHQELTK